MYRVYIIRLQYTLHCILYTVYCIQQVRPQQIQNRAKSEYFRPRSCNYCQTPVSVLEIGFILQKEEEQAGAELCQAQHNLG